MADVTIEERHGGDVPRAVATLLDSAGLPTGGLGGDGAAITLVAAGGGHVVGAAVVERYADDGLLRSVVVASSQRGDGIGQRPVAAAEVAAADAAIRCLYLLTEEATGFFADLGYRRVDRRAVPGPLQESDEFSVLCPVDAAVMMKRLHD
jgi:amino-acid N-acetyltransferase